MFQPFNKYKFLFLIFLFSSFLITSFNNCSDVPLVRDEESLDSSFDKQSQPPMDLIDAALAIRAPTCIACHAKVTGNFYTDFGYDNSFFNNESLRSDPFCTAHDSYMGKEHQHYGSRYSISAVAFDSFQTLNDGHFIVPQEYSKKQWDGQAYPDSYTRSIKNDLWEKFSPSSAVKINSNGRKFDSDSYIKEVKKLYIGAPTKEDLTLLTQKSEARLVFSDPGDSHFKVYAIGPNSTISGLNFLSNTRGDYYMANYKIQSGIVKDVQPISCFGDIVIMGGPILLAGNDLSQKSLLTDNQGCRIYVEHTVFLQDQFNIHQSQGGTENLQIASASAIFMGLGSDLSHFRLFDWEGGLRSGESCAAEESSASAPITMDFKIVQDRIHDAGPINICRMNFDKPNVGCIKTTTSSSCIQGIKMIGMFDNNVFKILNTSSDKYTPNELLPVINTSNVRLNCDFFWAMDAIWRYHNPEQLDQSGRGFWDGPTWEQYKKEKAYNGPDIENIEANNSFYSSRKVVSYEHIILNAPQIQSRYLGKFKGLIIGEYALFAVGNFLFEHDRETFSKIKILPQIYSKIFFSEPIDNPSNQSTAINSSQKPLSKTHLKTGQDYKMQSLFFEKIIAPHEPLTFNQFEQ